MNHKKILYTAIVDSHIKNFHIPYLKWLKENGYTVYVMTREEGEIPYCDVKIQVNFPKNIKQTNVISSIKIVKSILDKEKFDIIQLNTSIDATIVRLAYKQTKHKSKIIYTAHNLYIYKSAGIKNHLIYYPIEKILSKVTDVLITINEEDYKFCSKKFKAKNIVHINGIGIDETKFKTKTERNNINIKNELKLKDSDYVVIYPAEIRKRKNQMFVIKAMKKLVKKHNNIHLLLIGKDSTNGKYKDIVKKMGLFDNVHFLGYKKDIIDYLEMANLQISTSKQEGLPLNLLEGIFMENEIIATNCRGNKELIEKYTKGTLLKRNKINELVKEIEQSYKNHNNKLIKKQANGKDFEKYTLKEVLPQYTKFYL